MGRLSFLLPDDLEKSYRKMCSATGMAVGNLLVEFVKERTDDFFSKPETWRGFLIKEKEILLVPALGKSLGRRRRNKGTLSLGVSAEMRYSEAEFFFRSRVSQLRTLRNMDAEAYQIALGLLERTPGWKVEVVPAEVGEVLYGFYERADKKVTCERYYGIKNPDRLKGLFGTGPGLVPSLSLVF
jgi:hypothetical protein